MVRSSVEVARREQGTPRCEKIFTPFRLVIVFTAINLINYLDRGIIPGAPTQFQDFIQHSLHKTDTSTEFGLLSSAYIIGYALSSLVFGHLVHIYKPFRLMAIGLGMWCVAIFICGIAPSYWVLFAGRLLSGVGEASFQCIVPPFIDDQAPPKSRGMYLATFFLAIPVGYALGFAFGALVASHLGWRACFFIELVAMAPFAIMLPFLPDHAKRVRRMSVVEMEGEFMAMETSKVKTPSFWQEAWALVTNPIYMLSVLGYAAYSAVTAGVANFGPFLLIHLGLFNNEESASFLFGAVIATTGALGTPLGGVMLDRMIRRRVAAVNAKSTRHDEAEQEMVEVESKLIESLKQLTILSVFGLVLCLVAPFTTSKVVFFASLGAGTLFLFATTSGVNLAIMSSVPAKSRSFAIAVSTLLMHGFGDVPSSPLIGFLAGKLGPPCPGKPPTAECTKHRVIGLQHTLFLVIAWLIWTVVLWGIGWIWAQRRASHRLAKDHRKAQPLLGDVEGRVE